MARRNGDGESLSGGFAFEVDAQEIAFLEGEADAVVEVEGAGAILAGLYGGIDTEG